MDTKKFKPDPVLKLVWNLQLTISFIFIYIIPIILIFYSKQILIAIIYTIFSISCFLLPFWWIPKFYKTIEYTIKDDHIEITKGVFWQQNKSIPFLKITDVKAIQGPLQRYFRIGSLYLQTAGRGTSDTAEGRLTGLTDYKQKQQDLLNYIRKHYSISVEPKEEKQQTIQFKSESVLKEILKTLQNIEKQLKEK